MCLDNTKYDISIINADIPIGIIEKMAMKAVSEKKPLRLLFTGPSGTGKSAFVHHIAASLGVPLMSQKPGDIYSDRFGDSEKILEKILAQSLFLWDLELMALSRLEASNSFRKKYSSSL